MPHFGFEGLGPNTYQEFIQAQEAEHAPSTFQEAANQFNQLSLSSKNGVIYDQRVLRMLEIDKLLRGAKLFRNYPESADIKSCEAVGTTTPEILETRANDSLSEWSISFKGHTPELDDNHLDFEVESVTTMSSRLFEELWESRQPQPIGEKITETPIELGIITDLCEGRALFEKAHRTGSLRERHELLNQSLEHFFSADTKLSASEVAYALPQCKAISDYYNALAIHDLAREGEFHQTPNAAYEAILASVILLWNAGESLSEVPNPGTHPSSGIGIYKNKIEYFRWQYSTEISVTALGKPSPRTVLESKPTGRVGAAAVIKAFQDEQKLDDVTLAA